MQGRPHTEEPALRQHGVGDASTAHVKHLCECVNLYASAIPARTEATPIAERRGELHQVCVRVDAMEYYLSKNFLDAISSISFRR